MPDENRASDKWDEIILGIRGSCDWCKNAVRTLHLCDLVVLGGVDRPVVFGLNHQSHYVRPAPIYDQPPTVFLQRELVVEEQNPARDSPFKIIALGSVLAHEMAHHALREDWQVEKKFADVSKLHREKRQWVLDVLEAAGLAKQAGVPYDVIVGHWAIADEDMRASLLEQAAEESDQRVLTSERSGISGHENVASQVGLHVAEEWSAAVVGCMMSYRISKGYDYTKRMAQSVIDDLGTAGESDLVQRVLLAACQNPEAESRATDRAIASLEAAFHNPDIQECGQELKERHSSWKLMFKE